MPYKTKVLFWAGAYHRTNRMMKKALYILLVSGFLYGCSDSETDTLNFNWQGDWNDPTSINYHPDGYNPLDNRWILTRKNGKATNQFLVYKFDTQLYLSQSEGEPATGTQPQYSEPIAYKLNDTQFMLASTVYRYSITGADANTVLTVEDGINTLEFVPYKSEDWYWNGNWNKLDNPNYWKYKGAYNPLIGIWKLTNISNNIVKYSMYYQFTANFEWKKAMTAQTNFETISKFEINNTGIRTMGDDSYYQYKLTDGNSLEIFGRFENSNFYMKLVKNN